MLIPFILYLACSEVDKRIKRNQEKCRLNFYEESAIIPGFFVGNCHESDLSGYDAIFELRKKMICKSVEFRYTGRILQRYGLYMFQRRSGRDHLQIPAAFCPVVQIIVHYYSECELICVKNRVAFRVVQGKIELHIPVRVWF